jgi:hypothetical protein
LAFCQDNTVVFRACFQINKWWVLQNGIFEIIYLNCFLRNRPIVQNFRGFRKKSSDFKEDFSQILYIFGPKWLKKGRNRSKYKF